MFATLLAHQTHCALSDFRGKLGYLLVHGSILSRVGASTKPGAVQIVGLIGPTGTGKSSFHHTSVLPLVPATLSSDRPSIFVSAPAHGEKGTSINGVVRTILRSEHDISVDSKLHYCSVENGRMAAIPKRLDGQRDALRELLQRRRVRVLMIDEFVRVVRHTDNNCLMDSVQSIADDISGVLLLAGTPELLKFLNPNGQFARRAEVIYLHRYTTEHESEFNRKLKKNGGDRGANGQATYAPFEYIVRRLLSRWPLEEVPQFHIVMAMVFEATLGVVGLLKGLLATCLHRQLNNGGRWDPKFFWESTKSKAAIDKIVEEIEEGERIMKDTGYGVEIFDEKAKGHIASHLKARSPQSADASD